MRRAPALFVVTALILSACGHDADSNGTTRGSFAAFATKNTTRIAGNDPTALAAATAQAVFPGGSDGDRPGAVALVDSGDWQTALAASALVASPIRAPVLFTDGTDLPAITASALSSMDPKGSAALRGAQLIEIGKTAKVSGRASIQIAGADDFSRARSIDALISGSGKSRQSTVIVTGNSDPQFAMPAASLAAKTGAPILFTEKDSVPQATRAAIVSHGKPQIVVIGPRATVGTGALVQLRKLGRVVVASDASDAVTASIATAQFAAGGFGWGIVDPGHGLVFARSTTPLAAVAAAPLSASGTYGPLLLLDKGDELPAGVTSYLRRIQPGYDGDPSRGVYNHGWIVGDANAISVPVQSRIDSLLEIQKAN